MIARSVIGQRHPPGHTGPKQRAVLKSRKHVHVLIQPLVLQPPGRVDVRQNQCRGISTEDVSSRWKPDSADSAVAAEQPTILSPQLMASDQLPPINPQPSCNGLEDTCSGAGTQLHLEVAFKAVRDAAGLPASRLCHANWRRGLAVTAFQSPVDAMLLHDQPRQLEEGPQLPLAWDIHRLTLTPRTRHLRRVHSTDRGSVTHLSTGAWCPTYEKQPPAQPSPGQPSPFTLPSTQPQIQNVVLKKNCPKRFGQNVSVKTFAQNLLAPKPLTISINPKL